jgi:alkylation response protein AidB-like acyl-CoA dehydrogenase
MDMAPTEDQSALVDATAAWCRDNMPLGEARARPADLWARLEAMGWTGMTAPGADFDHASEALVFAELGRHLAPASLIATAVAARWSGPAGKTALAIFSDSGKPVRLRLIDCCGADRALGLGMAGVVVMRNPPGLHVEPGLDLSSPMAQLDSPPQGVRLDDPRSGVHLQILTAAYAVGCAEAACDMAADYAKLRQQFGRPIGWFQALKHLCADMAVRSAVARAQMCYAAAALDAGDASAAFHAAAAMRLSDQAALENARANIQVHGGIGMTDEANAHLCLKRAHLLSFVAPARRDVILGDRP